MILLEGFIGVVYAALYFISFANSNPTKKASISEQYLVNNLPGFDNISDVLKPTTYSGHLELHAENNTNYYFLKYEKPNDDSNNLIIWLNGGPGCSSMDGGYMGIGPLMINADMEVYYNNGTWLQLGSLLFLDQPIGTGFSYGDEYRNELTEVASDFMVFLKKYFEVFPNDLEKNLYIAGESYAGQYIPYFAKYILEDKTTDYNLKSVMIGNGWISAKFTGMSYIPYLIENQLITGKEDYMLEILRQQEKCQNSFNHLSKTASQAEKNKADKECDRILVLFLKNWFAQNSMCLNQYDYRLNDTYPSCGMNWPSDLNFIKSFLGNINVQRQLNLREDYIERELANSHGENEPTTYWNECNNRVQDVLTNQNSVSSEELLGDILGHIPVFLFNGDKDIICNYIGTEDFISELSWNDQKGFSDDSQRFNWVYNNSQVGTIQTERNLTYVRVFNASHMVYVDNADISRGVFDIVVNNTIRHIEDETIMETPVYDVNSSGFGYMQEVKSKIDGFHFRYAIYAAIIIIILYGIYYYNMQLMNNNQLHSILSNKKMGKTNELGSQSNITSRNSTHRKKTVQWADLQQEEQELEHEDSRDVSQVSPNLDSEGNASSRFHSFLDKFGLSKVGSSRGQYSNVRQSEEIELEENISRN